MPTQAKRGGRGTASKPLATSTIEELMPYAKDTGWDSGPVWMGTENLDPSEFDPQTVLPIISCSPTTYQQNDKI